MINFLPNLVYMLLFSRGKKLNFHFWFCPIFGLCLASTLISALVARHLARWFDTAEGGWQTKVPWSPGGICGVVMFSNFKEQCSPNSGGGGHIYVLQSCSLFVLPANARRRRSVSALLLVLWKRGAGRVSQIGRSAQGPRGGKCVFSKWGHFLHCARPLIGQQFGFYNPMICKCTKLAVSNERLHANLAFKPASFQHWNWFLFCGIDEYKQGLAVPKANTHIP